MSNDHKVRLEAVIPSDLAIKLLVIVPVAVFGIVGGAGLVNGRSYPGMIVASIVILLFLVVLIAIYRSYGVWWDENAIYVRDAALVIPGRSPTLRCMLIQDIQIIEAEHRSPAPLSKTFIRFDSLVIYGRNKESGDSLSISPFMVSSPSLINMLEYVDLRRPDAISAGVREFMKIGSIDR